LSGVGESGRISVRVGAATASLPRARRSDGRTGLALRRQYRPNAPAAAAKTIPLTATLRGSTDDSTSVSKTSLAARRLMAANVPLWTFTLPES